MYKFDGDLFRDCDPSLGKDTAKTGSCSNPVIFGGLALTHTMWTYLHPMYSLRVENYTTILSIVTETSMVHVGMLSLKACIVKAAQTQMLWRYDVTNGSIMFTRYCTVCLYGLVLWNGTCYLYHTGTLLGSYFVLSTGTLYSTSVVYSYVSYGEKCVYMYE